MANEYRGRHVNLDSLKRIEEELLLRAKKKEEENLKAKEEVIDSFKCEETQEKSDGPKTEELIQTIEKAQTEEKTESVTEKKKLGILKRIRTLLSEHPDKRKAMITVMFVSFALILALVTSFITGAIPLPSSMSLSDPGSISLNPMPKKLRNPWLENKEKNSDYLGEIEFDSGIVKLHIVQADDVYREDGTLYNFYSQDGAKVTDPEGLSADFVYIWTDWLTGKYDPYAKDGAVFMDYKNTTSDQNIILYGHHISRQYDPEGKSEFTPLDLLLEKDNYEANKNLRLILDNEVREYVVARVFTINAFNMDDVQITRTNLNYDLFGQEDRDFIERYTKDCIAKTLRYSTDVKLTNSDTLLTLVTCIQGQPDLRQIILCKETGRTVYD